LAGYLLKSGEEGGSAVGIGSYIIGIGAAVYFLGVAYLSVG
jgi:hypothetical protein